MLVTVNCLFIFIVSNVEKDLSKMIIILFKKFCKFIYICFIYFNIHNLTLNNA